MGVKQNKNNVSGSQKGRLREPSTCDAMCMIQFLFSKS